MYKPTILSSSSSFCSTLSPAGLWSLCGSPYSPISPQTNHFALEFIAIFVFYIFILIFSDWKKIVHQYDTNFSSFQFHLISS